MADKHIYKKHLTPEQYEVCWNKGIEPPFSGKYTTARTMASTNVSAATTAYSPPTRNSILAPDGPSFSTPIREASVKEQLYILH